MHIMLTCAYAHVYIHVYRHTNTHTNTHTHTETHTHTVQELFKNKQTKQNKNTTVCYADTVSEVVIKSGCFLTEL